MNLISRNIFEEKVSFSVDKIVYDDNYYFIYNLQFIKLINQTFKLECDKFNKKNNK